jgi:hypothetical protein
LLLGIGRLWIFDNFLSAHLIWNARFATYVIAIGALAWSAALALRAPEEDEHRVQLHRKGAAVAIVLVNLMALLALNFEVRDYFLRQSEAVAVQHSGQAPIGAEFRQLFIARDFAYSAVWMIYGAALMWAGFWRRSAFLRWQALVLMAITVVKVFVFDVSELERGYRIVSFIALGVLLLAVSFIYQRDWLRLSSRAKGDSTTA